MNFSSPQTSGLCQVVFPGVEGKINILVSVFIAEKYD